MEFRSQRGRGGDSHGYSSSSRRREEKPVRPKRRTVDDDRSSYRHSHVDTHRLSSADKESNADSRRSTSSGKAFTDDSRLSVLMKRVLRPDDDRDRRLQFVKQLHEFFLVPENYGVICKSCDIVFNALIDMLHERIPRDIKHEVSLCIGVLGYIESTESSRYFEMLFPKIFSEYSKEAKILLLSALLETLKQDEAGEYLQQFMPVVMSKCQTVLENADTPDVLFAVVDVISFIVKNHPHCFRPHFRDTVDILVGWHIDSTQKDKVIEHTATALIGFREFWSADLSFSVTLLGQFLEDMEAYVEDMIAGVSGQVLAEGDLEPEECVIKIASLLRVFTTVVQSLYDGSSISNQYLILDRLVKCADAVLQHCYNEQATFAANVCLRVLLVKLGVDCTVVRDPLLQYVSSAANIELSISDESSHYLHSSWLSLLTKVIEVFGTQLTTEFLTQIMGPQSILPRLCFSQDGQIKSSVLAVYKSIVSLRSVALMEEAYRILLSMLSGAYDMLLSESGSEARCHLSTIANESYMMPWNILSPSQAEITVILCICVLAEIGNAKNNIIGMWALSPNIFSLFSEHLLLTNVSMMDSYPAAHYAMINAFYSHCSRHNNFVLVSGLVTQNPLVDSGLLAVSETNARNLETIASLLAELLLCLNTPEDTRCLLLKWTNELLIEVSSYSQIVNSSAIEQLLLATVTTAYNPDQRITKSAAECLQMYMKNCSNVSLTVIESCLDLICIRLSDSDNEVQSAYSYIVQLLPLSVVIRLPCSLVDRELSSRLSTCKGSWGELYHHVIRVHMNRAASGTFHSHNFNTVMACLLRNTSKQPDTTGSSWLERQFFSCQRSGEKETAREELYQLSAVIDRNDRLLWFWAMWEAAQFCILSRLRTPLGKPQDTFAAIEAAVKQCSAAVQRRDTTTVPPSKPAASSLQDIDVHGLCLHTSLLLQFMEYLERHLYNAIEGCAVTMAPLPKAVRTFFWTNRATCREWLSRVRLQLMLIAQSHHDWATVVRHGYLLLAELSESNSTPVGEFEHVMVLVVDALCRLRAPDAVHGLLIWSRDIAGRRLNWMKSSIDVAHAKYESAAASFKVCLQSYLSSDLPAADNSRESSPLHMSSTKTAKVLLLHKSQESSSRDANVVSYIVRQVCESYVKLRAWDEALSWQETVESYAVEHSSSPLHKAFNTGYDSHYLRALSSFDCLDFGAAKQNLDSAQKSVVGIDVADSDTCAELLAGQSWFSATGAVELARHKLLRAVTALHVEDDSDHARKLSAEWLAETLNLCKNVLHITSSPSPSYFDKDAVLLHQFSSAVNLQLSDATKPLAGCSHQVNDEIRFVASEHDVTIPLYALHSLLQQIALEKHLNKSSGMPDVKGHLSELRLAAASLARHHSCYNLCERLLREELTSTDNGSDDDTSQPTIFALMSQTATRLTESDTEFGSRQQTRAYREVAKLVYGRGQIQDGIELMTTTACHSVRLITSLTSRQKSAASVSELCARSLLSLSKWLQADSRLAAQYASLLQMTEQTDCDTFTGRLSTLVDMTSTSHVNKPGICIELSPTDRQANIGEGLADGDMLVGQLLKLSTMQCPTLAKTWFTLANWCYKWGRKAVDNAAHGSVELTADEKSLVLQQLPTGVSHTEVDAVLAILGQILTGSTAANEEDIGEQDQTRYDDGTETVRRQLIACLPLLEYTHSDCIEQLVIIWRSIVRRVYHYYQQSAKAYFTYLQLNSGATSDVDGKVTATLRLLRMLVKHAWELRDVLEEGLASSPTSPWKGIIPQLFSRLSHPEPYVRLSVSDLLCRVAHDAPHLIVYPAVVGYSSGKDSGKEDGTRDGLLNEYLAEGDLAATDSLDTDVAGVDDAASQDDDVANDDRSVNVIQNCFATILDTLATNNPRMISEVQLFVGELRRITLLWDELWLGALGQLYQDVMRRLKQLENEMAKVSSNAVLSAEEAKAIIQKKHMTVLKPTVYTMERLHEITSRPPETPHEVAFYEAYGEMIDSALDALQNPANPENPNASWLVFKQLHHSLQQKRAGQVLNMEEISPRLAGLRSTVIAMPGLQANSTGPVAMIESVHSGVQVIPTKTKPKKLIFIGSDGLRYQYLFKGLEDLHLDERIMQLLSIINNMFVTSTSEQRRLYRARHYSVTPLGARSGLIQWVDGATPMFSLYKRWHQRDAALKDAALKLQQQQQQQQQQSGVSASTASAPATAAAPRPTELFYSKLNPLLKERAITNTENRKDWPLSILRKVLEELMNETPKDLLAKELWCSSGSATEWWLVTQTYARSTAVMSVIGYVIGLGDRHLDNVLVDLTSGEVVHIDYNVCFEKGRSLRVPERVPFRMTQNLETALGLTGVEGLFRLSCEHVMRTLRRGRETLLTLLEAFVYDPLVDWTVGSDWGGGSYTGAFYGGGQQQTSQAVPRQSRREMERDITVDMFSIRVAEARVTWLANRDELLTATQKFLAAVKTLLNTFMTHEQASSSRMKLQQQLTYLTEADSADASHPVHTIVSRYKEYLVAKEQKIEMLKAIDDKLNECEKFHKAHQFAVEVVRGPKLQKMSAEISKSISMTALSSFAPVIEFLQGAGQSQLVSQSEQSCQELQSAIQQHQTLAKVCLDVLHTYATIVSHHPHSVEQKNRCNKWQQWLRDLICDFTATRVQRITAEMHSLYSVSSISQSHSAHIVNIERRLQSAVLDSNLRLHKLVELSNANSSETAAVQLQSSMAAITQFVQERSVCGALSVANVVVMELCTVVRRYLDIEAAVAVDRIRLSEPQSPGTAWFLDQLLSAITVTKLLFDLLADSTIREHMQHVDNAGCKQVMAATHSLYLSLQDLNFNFQTVILPEALTAFQAEEPSVLSIVNDLDGLVSWVGIPLDDVIETLEQLLVNATSMTGATFTMSTSDEQMLFSLKRLRLRFERLFEANVDSSEMTPGQMLLMGFAGMYSRLDADFKALVDAASAVQIIDKYKKADLVREAAMLQMFPMHDETAASLLSLLFFAKKLRIMNDFFQRCQAMAALLNGSVDGTFYDDEQFVQPVKLFIGDYLHRHVCGLSLRAIGQLLCQYIATLCPDDAVNNLFTSSAQPEVAEQYNVSPTFLSLRDLSVYTVDSCIANSVFDTAQFDSSRQLLAAVLDSLSAVDTARQLDLSLQLQKTACQRTQLQLMSYQWLYEDVLTSAGHQTNTSPRSTLMTDLKKAVHALVGHERDVTLTRSHHEQLKKTVLQRLKWAAGANPSLAQTLMQFEEALAVDQVLLEGTVNVANKVLTVSQSVLHLEAMMTRTQEAVSADSAFLLLMNNCETCCLLQESSASIVTETEAVLMESHSATDQAQITAEWIAASVKQVSNELSESTTSLDAGNSAVDSARESLKLEVNGIRSVLAIHHKIMSEMRAILKAMAKQEEHDYGPVETPLGVRAYLTRYKQFSEPFTNVLKMASADDVDLETCQNVEKMAGNFMEQIRLIYNDLVAMAPSLVRPASEDRDTSGDVDSVQFKKSSTLSAVRSESASTGSIGTVATRVTASKEKVSRDPKTGKAVQERNSYAVGVWRRVRLKLDGRDVDSNKRMTVAEQVDYVIREATSVDNLAVLYEGWTPWV